MASTVNANVILESISVRSPGVGSMWEFTFFVDGQEQPKFKRVIPDGQTANFRKTLFAMDIPAKQAKSVTIQCAVREIDLISDYGGGGTSISIDTTFGTQTKANFQAQVTERGGTRMGAVATLTFNLVSEVRGGKMACEDCDTELRDAEKIPSEFETVVGELLAMLIPGTLASDFDLAFNAYDQARVNYEIARNRWDDSAKQVRACAQQNPNQVKAKCLQAIARIESYNDQLNTIGLDLIPLLNTRADYMSRRYMAFVIQERAELEIARYEAQLQAECEDDLAKIRAQLKAAKENEKDANANISAIAKVEQQAERDAKKLFARFLTRITSRNNAAATFLACAGNQEFGTCSAQAQALGVEDAQLASALVQLQIAYQNVDMLLNRYNSQLSATDNRLELLIENYTDALKEYTDCVERLG